MSRDKSLTIWKRKKIEVEARVKELERIRSETVSWLEKASSNRKEMLWRRTEYLKFLQKQQRLNEAVKDTALKLDSARRELAQIDAAISRLDQERIKVMPLIAGVAILLLLGLGAMFAGMDSGITGLVVSDGVPSDSAQTPSAILGLYNDTLDTVTIPETPPLTVKKTKTVQEIIKETNIAVDANKVKEIKQTSYSSVDVTFENWKYAQGLFIHKPLIDGKEFKDAVPLVEKDENTYTSIFEGTAIDVKFDQPESSIFAAGFNKSKLSDGDSWKIAYNYLLPSEDYVNRIRISSSSPIVVTDDYLAKMESGKFVLDFAAERANNYDISVLQPDQKVVYVYLTKNYTEEGKHVNDEIVVDPTLTISGTTLELCGTVTAYDLIDVNNGGVLTICTQNTTEQSGKVNITLGYFGNFSLDQSSRIEGKGLGATGGVGVTGGGNGAGAGQGNNGDNATNGSIAVTPNGGGGGGGQKVGNNDAAAGAGGAFGGAGGKGGLSAAGSAGLGGVTYGATNSLELKMGSGGGGSVADTGRNGGGGGAGIKIVTGAGGWIGIRGIVNVSGKNGTDSVAGTADSAGGGGGSGGHVVLIGGTMNLAAGIISADGGGGGLGSGTDSCPGGGGGGGRIYIVYNTLQSNLTRWTTNHGYLGGNVSADAACNNPSDALGATHGVNGTNQMNQTHFDLMPSIYLSAPANLTTNTTDATPEFRFNVSDDLFAQSFLNCTLYAANATYPTSAPIHLASNHTVFNATSVVLSANSSLNNGPYTWWINCSDGAKQFGYGIDNEGPLNYNSSETRNITINIAEADNTAPTIINFWMNYTNGTNFTTSTLTKIIFNATINDSATNDLAVHFGFSNGNGTEFNYTSTKNFTLYSTELVIDTLTDGIYSATIYANDTSNNRNVTVANLTFSLDRVAPIVGAFWMNASNASNFSSSLVSILYFNATVNDTTLTTQEVRFGFYNGNATGVNITGVKNAAGVWTANVTAAAFSDGVYTVILSANDTVDNRNNTIANLTFTLDRTAPLVTAFWMNASNASNFSSSLVSILYFNATVNDTTLTTQEVRFGFYNGNSSGFNITGVKNAAGVWTANVTASVLSDGVYTVLISANDTVDNRNNTVANLTFTLDRTAPLVNSLWLNYTGPAQNNNTNHSVAIIRFNATVNDTTLTTQEVRFGFYNGNASGFNITGIKDGAGVWSANVSTTSLSDAVYTVLISANDTVDNRNNTIANLTFTSDRTAPIVGAFWMNASNASNFSSSLVSILYFNATVNDTTLSTQEVRFGFYNGNATGVNITGVKNAAGVWTANVTAAAFTDGLYTAILSANDTVDNRNNTIANLTFTLDRTAPNVSTFFMNTSNATSYIVGTATVIVINATLNDSLGTVQEVVFGILNTNNNTQFNITASKQNSFWYTNLSMNTLSIGSYTIWLYGNDTLGNMNNSIANLSFSITSADSTPPNVTALIPALNSFLAYGNATEIAVNVTDGGIISMVLANISLPNGSIETLTLSNSTSFPLKFNISYTPLINGVYNVTFIANDSLDNKNGTERTNFTAQNVAPVITFVSSLPSQSILEGTYRTINFSFTAFDGNNAGDLDNASAQVRINLSGEAERLNTSCTPLAVLDAYTINYSCSVNIWYYDGAGTWTINASVKDDINTYVENSSNFFEVLSTTAMVMNPTALTWPTLELGTTNKTANNDPFTINNTGNKDIAAGGITVTGYDLQGTSIPTDYIRAQNFSIWHVNGSSSCSGVSCLECNGTIMVNATAEPLAYANISAANNSLAYQNETSGQENLFVCLMTVPAEIIRQSYNTAGINTAPWIITVS